MDVTALAQPMYDFFFNEDMGKNLAAEGIGALATAFVLERYLAWLGNRRLRNARRLLVEDLGTRLDLEAHDWHWTLSQMAQLGISDMLQSTSAAIVAMKGKTDDAIDKGAELATNPTGIDEVDQRIRDLVGTLARVRSITAPITGPATSHTPEKMPVDRAPEARIRANVNAVVSRLTELLDLTNSSAAIMTSDMNAQLLEMRRSLHRDLAAFRDLKAILDGADEDERALRRATALQAAVSVAVYRKALSAMWEAIPARGAGSLPEFAHLAALEPEIDQWNVVRQFMDRRHSDATASRPADGD